MPARKSDGLGAIVLENGPLAIRQRLKPVLEAGREARLLRFDSSEEAYRTFFGLVVRDTQIRLLLGETRPDAEPRSTRSGAGDGAVPALYGAAMSYRRVIAENPLAPIDPSPTGDVMRSGPQPIGRPTHKRETSMRVYYDRDADLALILNKKIAIVGYGCQGHAHALNLRDSGVKNVAVALRPGSASAKKVEADGLKVMSVAEAASLGRRPHDAGPRRAAARHLQERHRAQHPRRRGAAFAHGLNVHFNLIEPKATVDVLMVAPKGPGHTVRGEYQKGGGVPCLIAVHQNATGNAHDLGLAYASAIGGGRSGIIETNFREECETDLFGEQAVLCGGLVELIRAGFETLVEAGYAPEMAYFECLHEVKLIVDLIYEGGIANMNYSISNTAEYGEYVTGPRIVTAGDQGRDEARAGGHPVGPLRARLHAGERRRPAGFKATRRRAAEHQIEEVGERLRAMMPWIRPARWSTRRKN